jgi:hypothetical protein
MQTVKKNRLQNGIAPYTPYTAILNREFFAEKIGSNSHLIV